MLMRLNGLKKTQNVLPQEESERLGHQVTGARSDGAINYPSCSRSRLCLVLRKLAKQMAKHSLS